MKVMLAHNFYSSELPSGENQVFEAERLLLKKNGHEVIDFIRNSDVIRSKGAWGVFQGACSTVWNPFSAAEIQNLIELKTPDVVHAHNTFPLLSPSIFHAIGHRSARVLTLHNYRLFCPAAIPMRAGKVCTECLDKSSVLPSLRHGCYRNSRLATFPLAANVAVHRYLNTWSTQVDAYIVLTEFQRERMIEAGLPAQLVHVKPNFFPGNPSLVPWITRENCVVFAGRLTPEKGVLSLVHAWLLWGASAPELRIVGDGDLRSELERLAATAPEVPIRFLGQLSGLNTQMEIARARLLVLPSECFEGFPMVVREAFAFGTPVAVSNIGPLPSIVQDGENGLLFEPHNPHSLLSVVRTAWSFHGGLEVLALGARRSFDSLYNEYTNYRALIKIYESAIDVSKNRLSFFKSRIY